MVKSIAAPPGSKSQTTSIRPETLELITKLRSLVDRNTRRWKALIILEALSVAIAVPTGYFLLAVLLDNSIHLPVWGRISICGVFFMTLIGFAIRLCRQWGQARFTEDQVALAMEKQTPGVENRLINALQIARQGAQGNAALNQEVIYDNYQRLKRIEIQQAVKIRPALIRLSVAAFIVGVGVAFWFFQPELFLSAATRIINPLAKITPIYRTVLTVEPGNMRCEPGGDVTIKVSIKGDIPSELVIFRSSGEMRSSETIGIEPKATSVTYTFRNVQRSVSYSIKGGDFTSDTYLIDVPTPPQINLVRSSYHYPEYTRLPDQKIESAGGDMEALYGTKANLAFVLDQSADKATLLVEKISTPAGKAQKDDRDATTTSSIERIEMKKLGTSEFSVDIVFADVLGYQIETQTGSQTVRKTVSYGLRVMADQAPSLTLTGIDRKAEAQIGASLALKVNSDDDYGLSEIALFYRKIDIAAKAQGDDWKQIIAWPVANSARQFQVDYTLSIASLSATEGDQIEILLRAKDGDPLKNGQWTSGEAYNLLIGGEGVALQVLYEHILQSEADIRTLITAQNLAATKTTAWNQKLDSSSGLRWDDKKNLDALGTALREQAKAQEEEREKMGKVARSLTEPVSSLRLPLGLLADTEVSRSVANLESVTRKDTPQDMRSMLADARLTMERTSRSLNDILEQYVRLRKDWELANMTPFVKMLADRQVALQNETAGYKDKPPVGPTVTPLRNSVSQRQNKLLLLSNLAQVALKGIGERVTQTDAILGKAFTEASATFDTSGLKSQMQHASTAATAGHWAEALPGQTKAGESLNKIHFLLQKAALDTARRVKTDPQHTPPTGLTEQQPLAPNQAGPLNSSTQNPFNIVTFVKTGEVKKTPLTSEASDFSPGTNLDQYIRNVTVQKSDDKRPGDGEYGNKNTPDGDSKITRTTPGPGNPNVIAKVPEFFEEPPSPPLISEIEKLYKGFETLQANSSALVMDVGKVGTQGGEANGFSASSQLGNQLPPPVSADGFARSGRPGGLATGINASMEAASAQGRENPLEGVNNIADQAGTLKSKDDKPSNSSPGTGGQSVDSKHTQFSTSESGQFDPEKSLPKMTTPQQTNKLVDRKGAPIDPKIAALMRDLKSNQEQLTERIKSLRKDLKNLYLPTDGWDKAILALSLATDRLDKVPDENFFQQELQLLSSLRQKLQVFETVSSSYQPSAPRTQTVQGKILDEPSSQTAFKYEDTVKNYFEKLGTQ
ncbi:MAG: hypothetical protein ABI615_06345 [Chthoniobacterales bacterium]